MKSGFSNLNPMKYLTHQEMEYVLLEAFKDPEPEVFFIALSHTFDLYGLTEVEKVAKSNGLSPEDFQSITCGKTRPTWDTVARLLRGMNKSKVKRSNPHRHKTLLFKVRLTKGKQSKVDLSKVRKNKVSKASTKS